MRPTPAAPVVSVTGGMVIGTESGGIATFRGIPYAAPPVGPFLLAAPQPVVSWEGHRRVVDTPPSAPQGRGGPTGGTNASGRGEQDYLTVNVWSPSLGRTGSPVMVWIHGGGFFAGSASFDLYDGASLAGRGVVVVSFNYRLGAIGFAQIEGAPSNRGLRDQIAALRWVQDNIKRFGGDPDAVTLVGQSAGGSSIAALMSSPHGAGLFTRAIIQSGSAELAFDSDDARMVTKRLLEVLALDQETESRTSIEGLDVPLLLRAQSRVMSELAESPDPHVWGATTVTRGVGLLAFAPVIDGDLLPALPADLDVSTLPNGMSVLTGTMRAEWNQQPGFRDIVANNVADSPNEMQALGMWLRGYGIGPDALAVYATNRPTASATDLGCAIMTDFYFRRPTYQLARRLAAGGVRTYVYEFAWAADGRGRGGPVHDAHLPFVFGTRDRLPHSANVEAPADVQEQVQTLWTTFASAGSTGMRSVPAGVHEPLPVRVLGEGGPRTEIDPRPEELRSLPM